MEFKCNEAKWRIEVIPKWDMRIKAENDYTMGLTIYAEQVLYLSEEQANILKTLKHELIHVWLYEYGHSQKEKYTDEEVCEIVACANDFINEEIEAFKQWQKKK